jgi:DNA-binding CsgD family transcriptional regulator
MLGTLGYRYRLPERTTYERAQREIRGALGEPAFATAWAAGRAMTPEQAICEASALVANAASAPAADESGTSATGAGLTPRELDILRLLVAGMSNPEIADVLFVSPRTVSTHLTHIFAKLGVDGRAEAVAIAVRRGLV